MSHTGVGVQVFSYEVVLEFGDFPLFFVNAQVVVQESDP
jgi:hypothetical protein